MSNLVDKHLIIKSKTKPEISALAEFIVNQRLYKETNFIVINSLVLIDLLFALEHMKYIGTHSQWGSVKNGASQ